MNAIRKCYVIGCDSDSNRNNSLSFHMFPTKKHIALKWLKKLEHLIPSLLFEPIQICEKHFENRFLLEPGILARNAYPTLFTPKEIATGLPENFENDEYLTLKEHNYSSLKKGIWDHNYSQNTPEDCEKSQISIKHENVGKEKNTIIDDSPKIVTGNTPIIDIPINGNNDDTKISLPKYVNILPKPKTYDKKPANSGFKNITNTQPNSKTGDSKGAMQGQQHYTVTLHKATKMPILLTHEKSTTKPATKLNDHRNVIETAMDFDDNDTGTDFDVDNNTAINYNNDIKVINVKNQQTIDAAKFKSKPKTTFFMAQSIKKLMESSKIYEAKYKESLLQMKKLRMTLKRKDERIKRMKFDKKVCFDKLTKHITNPLAKKFLWMQIRRAPKTSHGNRFTDEEKTICIYIRKQNPECYRMLSKIFTLPTCHSLYKFLKLEMAPKNKVDS